MMTFTEERHGYPTSRCHHMPDSGIVCPACCPCDRCATMRAEVNLIADVADMASSNVARDHVIETVHQLLKAFVGDDDSEQVMAERLGFCFGDLPDIDTLTDEQRQVYVFLIGVVSTSLVPLNNAASVVAEQTNAIAKAAVTGALFDELMAHNIWLMVRDLVILVCRLGLMNPGLLSVADIEHTTSLGRVPLFAQQAQYNVGETADVAKEFTEIVRKTLDIMEEQQAKEALNFGDDFRGVDA